MSGNKKQLALGVFLTRHGHHPGAWRQPGSAKSGRPDFSYWADLVRTAERGKLDTAFFADFAAKRGRPYCSDWARRVAAADRGKPKVPFFDIFAGQRGAAGKGRERRHAFLVFEPLTLTAALASITSRIGLVATVNTNFEQPYAL